MRAPIHRYTSGIPYWSAGGRDAPADAIDDRLAKELAVIDLDTDQPTVVSFIRCIHRELKIRNCANRTIKAYLQATRSILRWLGQRPHDLSGEHVRGYLEYLYDAGHGPSDMGVHLSAIRTVWDKLCYRDVTLGLETPRKRRKRPVVLSRQEITRLSSRAKATQIVTSSCRSSIEVCFAA